MSGQKPLSRFHQPISVPGRRLLQHVPLSFVAKKVSGGGGKAVNHEIPLIPFIDFLLCIVLFLLASFSASGELPIDKNVKLPSAEHVDDMVEAPMVALRKRPESRLRSHRHPAFPAGWQASTFRRHSCWPPEFGSFSVVNTTGLPTIICASSAGFVSTLLTRPTSSPSRRTQILSHNAMVSRSL